jgi:hexosaminidase
MNTDLIHLSANAPLIQPVLPMSNNLSTISKQLLLKKRKMSIKALSALLEQFTIRFSGCGISRLR